MQKHFLYSSSGLILCISQSLILLNLNLQEKFTYSYSTCLTNFIIKISHKNQIYYSLHYYVKVATSPVAFKSFLPDLYSMYVDQ